MATLPAAVVVPLGLLFFLSGLIVNAIQATCFVLVRPFSKNEYRRINCQVAELLWLELVFLVDWWARVRVGGRLRCIGSPQHLKTRFGNHLELEVKLLEVSSAELETLSLLIQGKLPEVPSRPRSLLIDLESCIGRAGITSDSSSMAEISLSKDLIIMIANWLGNKQRVKDLVNSNVASNGIPSEEL